MVEENRVEDYAPINPAVYERLDAALEERRQDSEFMERLQKRVDEDRDVLARLAELD